MHGDGFCRGWCRERGAGIEGAVRHGRDVRGEHKEGCHVTAWIE